MRTGFFLHSPPSKMSSRKRRELLSLRLNLKPSSFFFLVRFYAYLGAASHLFFALSFSSCGKEGGEAKIFWKMRPAAVGGRGRERRESTIWTTSKVLFPLMQGLFSFQQFRRAMHASAKKPYLRSNPGLFSSLLPPPPLLSSANENRFLAPLSAPAPPPV